MIEPANPVLNTNDEVKWYFILIVNIFITIFSIFCGKHGILPFVNYFVPDSGHYEYWVLSPVDRGVRSGFLYINAFLYDLGVQSFVVYNTILLLGSVYFCTLFKVFSPKAVTFARASIVFNPYLLISIIGPTKEINLIFFSLFTFYLFSKKEYSFKVLSIIPALFAVGIRPQFGAIVLLSLICYLLVQMIKNPITICISILLGFLLLNSIPAINNIISNSGGEDLEFYRTSNFYPIALILKGLQENPILQIVALSAKLILTMFAPIARPNSIFSPYIPLLDWGYSFLASVFLPLNISFLLLLVSKRKVTHKNIDPFAKLLIIYTFLGILSVIISPIFSARYLFPYCAGLAACFTLHSVRVRNRILILSLFLSICAFIGSAVFLPLNWTAETNKTPYQFLSWL